MSPLSVLVPAPYSWLIRAGAVLAVALALSATGWVNGAAHVQSLWDAERARLATARDRIAVRQAEATTRVITRYVDRVQTVREAAQTITKEIPVYVTKDDDARCAVPAGFVRLWNAANRGSDPGTAGGPDASAGAVVLSDVAAQHAGEAEQCRATEEQLIGLQDWVRSQRSLSEISAQAAESR